MSHSRWHTRRREESGDDHPGHGRARHRLCRGWQHGHPIQQHNDGHDDCGCVDDDHRPGHDDQIG
ncbi:MAG: hypothetical protein OES57_04090, partial [Acidimicrobiia bacterium]|nr:hypothetical protein [Acidimicrobiia bacterium]